MDKITLEKLDKYFKVTEKAIEKAKNSGEKINLEKAKETFLDMVIRYFEDAKHFYKKNDFVNAFAALNYAHGWLDAGARLGIFDVHDSSLFAQD